jgi:hypothetical protein
VSRLQSQRAIDKGPPVPEEYLYRVIDALDAVGKDAVGWKLTAAQVAKLDAASAPVPAYPYWHQRGTFPERNPPPV